MLQWSQNFRISTILSWHRWSFGWTNNGRKVWATAVLFLSGIMYRKVIHVKFFFLPYLQDQGLLRCRNFAAKGQGLYLSVTFFVELIIGRGSYIQCMKRLRKGENICVLFENPTHCSIGTAGRINKCREDHGSYRCSSQSRSVSLTAMIFFAFSLWEWTELCVTIYQCAR